MTAPANDNFADAAPVVLTRGVYISDPISNADATREDGGTAPEPRPGITYRTCWWRITPTDDMEIRLDTELTTGSTGDPDYGPDTTLQVLTGASITTLSEVAYNDDIDNAGGNFKSRIDSLWLTAGTTYHIVVGQHVAQTAPLAYRLRVQALTLTKIIRPTIVVVTDAPEHAATSTPNVVGDNAWSDESDATYIDLRVEAISDTPNPPIETRQDTVRATFEPANISGLISAELQVRGFALVEAAGDGNTEIDPRYDFLAADSSVGLSFDGSLSPSTVEWSFPITGGDFDGTPTAPITLAPGFTFDDFEAQFNAGIPVNVYLNAATVSPEEARIYEFRIQLTYAADLVPLGAAPLRQFPRTDGLATSSARRLWPPSRSRQRSNRRAGGYL